MPSQYHTVLATGTRPFSYVIHTSASNFQKHADTGDVDHGEAIWYGALTSNSIQQRGCLLNATTYCFDNSRVPCGSVSYTVVERREKMHALVLLGLQLFCLSSSDAFSLLSTASFSSGRLQQRQHISQTRLALAGESNKEEEIAKLEEQLRRLREETEAEDAMAKKEIEESGKLDESRQVVSTSGGVEYVGRGPAKRPVQPMEEMLTEAWKAEQAPKEEDSGLLPKILGPIALFALLVALAQVPVGQEDLSKYQGIKSPTTQIDLGDLNPSNTNN